MLGPSVTGLSCFFFPRPVVGAWRYRIPSGNYLTLTTPVLTAVFYRCYFTMECSHDCSLSFANHLVQCVRVCVCVARVYPYRCQTAPDREIAAPIRKFVCDPHLEIRKVTVQVKLTPLRSLFPYLDSPTKYRRNIHSTVYRSILCFFDGLRPASIAPRVLPRIFAAIRLPREEYLLHLLRVISIVLRPSKSVRDRAGEKLLDIQMLSEFSRFELVGGVDMRGLPIRYLVVGSARFYIVEAAS